MGLFNKLFGTRSEREIKKFSNQVDGILALEPAYRALTDEELKAKTVEFKERLAKGETLDDILVEAFAAIREAADRVLGMRGLAVEPLAQNRSCNRQCKNDRRTIAEEQHTGNSSRQQRNADILHDARSRDIVTQMRRRRNHIIGHFDVPPY